MMHCKLLYRRVDDGSSSGTTKRPGRVVFEWGVTKPPKLPAIKKPPADVTARLVKRKLRTETVVGFTCQVNDGQRSVQPIVPERTSGTPAPCADQSTQRAARVTIGRDG
jgi:hypothetical protein